MQPESNTAAVFRGMAVDGAIAVLLAISLGFIYWFDARQEPITLTGTSDGILSPKVGSRLASSEVRALGQKDRERPTYSTEADSLAEKTPAEDGTLRQNESDSDPAFPAQSDALLKSELMAARLPAPLVPAKHRALEQVEFFKTRTQAKSVAFVVDCSGSMSGDKFQRAQAELSRSVMNLQRGQSFYVIFFNDAYIPMFDDAQNPVMAQALPESKTAVADWLNQVPCSGGTNPEPALALAAELKPEVIYLLTDGKFRPLSDSVLDALMGHHIAVHTLGFGSDSDTSNLQHIASVTGGTYRPVTLVDATESTLYLAPITKIIAALKGRDVVQRRTAVEVIVRRELECIDQVFEELANPDPQLRGAVHEVLVSLNGNTDFGPTIDGDEASTKTAISRWQLWWKWRLDAKQVALKLSSDNTDDCWVAVSLARQLTLDLGNELVALLGHSSIQVRTEAHAALVQLISGTDFGPTPDAAKEQIQQALARWVLWSQLRQHGENIAAKLSRDNGDECWVAVALARHLGLELPLELISLLQHPSVQVRAEARGALVQLSGGTCDFGPPPDASPEQLAAASTQWNGWYADRLVRAIVLSAQDRKADPTDELVLAMKRSNAFVSRAAHAALARMADGSDFGPATDADLAELARATERWTLWSKWRNDDRQIAAKLISTNVNECWVAAALARQLQLKLPDQLVVVVGHSSVHIRREARAALLHLTEGKVDFGPADDATDVEISTAAEKWRSWRAAIVAKAAAEQLAAQEVIASKKLKFAQQLDKQGRVDPAKQRYVEIVQDYPDTKAAEEARNALALYGKHAVPTKSQ